MTNSLKIQYKSKSYSGSLAFITIWFFIMGGVFLIAALVNFLDFPPLIGFVFAAFIFVSPIIFIKKIKTIFTNRVLLEMDKDSISISYLNSDDDSVKKQKIYQLDSIQSYNFYLGESTPVLTTLTLHFKEGMPKSFNFIDKQFSDTKSFNQMFESESLINLFYNQVKQYNIDKTEENKIQLLSGFFASKTGTLIIYSIVTLIIVAIILHLIIAPKSSFATLLISIGLVAGFFSKKKASLELYKKIKELDKE